MVITEALIQVLQLAIISLSGLLVKKSLDDSKFMFQAVYQTTKSGGFLTCSCISVKTRIKIGTLSNL